MHKRPYKGVIILLFVLISLTVSAFVIVNRQDNRQNYNPRATVDSGLRNLKTSSKSSSITKTVVHDKDWSLTLVNKWNPIQADIDIDIVELSNGESVDKRIFPYLQKMFDAAREDGIYPVVASGYRTEQEQADIYKEKLSWYESEGLSEKEARKETELWVAIPGTSEHELGLAVDINADGVHSEGNDVYEWLNKNAHLYGFIYRYPQEKTDITGVANEPWHYRFVGEKAAKEIHEKSICLEEYLDQIQ